MIYIIINSILITGVLLSAMIILLKKTVRFPFRILAVWMLCNLLYLVYPILVELHQLENFPHYYRLPAPFFYLAGPFLYLFTRSLLNNEKKFKRYDWMHAIPFLLHFAELVPFYLNPVSIKIDHIRQLDLNTLSQFTNSSEGILNAKFHTMFKFLSILIYMFLSTKLYWKYLQQEILFNRDKFNRISVFIGTILVTRYFVLVLMVFVLFNKNSQYNLALINLPFSITILVMLFLLLRNTINLAGISDAQFDNLFSNSFEKEIEEKSIKLKAMDSSTNDMTLFISTNYQLFHFNHAATSFFLDKQNINLSSGQKLKKIFSNASYPIIKETIDLVMFDGVSRNIELSIFSIKGDKSEWFSLYFSPVYDNNSSLLGVTISAKNINIKREIERQNKEYIKSLENIAWRESHIMRAPVANIIGLANHLSKMKENADDLKEYQVFVNHILAEAERLDTIIRENVMSTSIR